MATAGQVDEILKKSTEVFRRDLLSYPYSLQDTITRGAVDKSDLLSFTPYGLFLEAWFSALGEDETQHGYRLAANYIRHNYTCYDKIIEDVKSRFVLGKDFFVDLWRTVMVEIVKKFPELKETFVNGLEAKKEWLDKDRIASGDKVSVNPAGWEKYWELRNKQQEFLDKFDQLN